jgi:DNA polymerase III subunit delta'
VIAPVHPPVKPAMLQPAILSPPPRDNPDLIGHEAAEAALLQAFRNNRLHHAWLITGPRGIGKATLAFRFGRFLLASGNPERKTPSSFLPVEDSAPDLAVGPEHPTFKRIASGGHADLISVARRVNEKTGRLRAEILVEDVRGVTNLLAHTPAEDGWRVVVIDAAEDMSRSSANALLKVLEEPPARSIFLLVSHAPGQVLPTIRSRCRHLALQPLSQGAVTTLLRRYRPALPAAEADGLACLCKGSIGLALSLSEGGGLALHATMLSLMQKLPALDIVALDRLGDQVSGTGSDEKFAIAGDFFCGLMTRLIRTAAVQEQNEGDASTHSDEQIVLARLAPAASLDRWLEVWEKTHRLLARAENANLDRKQVVLDLFLTLQSAVRS